MLDMMGARIEFSNAQAVAQPLQKISTRIESALFMRLLDELDYGLLLVDASGRILHANHLARHELSSRLAMCAQGDDLAAIVPSQAGPLERATQRACEGKRVLIELGLADARLVVAFTPLAHPMDGIAQTALLICGKRQPCQALSLRGFAQLHGLTRAEEEVLRQVCAGAKPKAVAHALGIGLATVRTQIMSIRRRTGAKSMTEVIQRMAALPPLVPALRLH